MMKALAWSLFLVGTLVAAGAGAKLPPIWSVFAVGIVLAIVGAFMLRRQLAAEVGADGDGTGIADLAGLAGALGELAAEVDALADAPDGEALKAGIEAAQGVRILPILEARMLLASAHGIEPYAEVFTPFASGERCLSRAWSALVDGHLTEARGQIPMASAHFRRAVEALPA
jgi:hypothetical protein